MSSKKKKGPWLIIFIIILAFIIGNLTGKESGIFGITYFSIFDLIGTLFIRALTLVVVPLVLSSIISGISRIAGDASFKSISIKTLSFYVLTTLSAVLIGLFSVHIFQPGNSETLRLSVQSQDIQAVGEHLAAHEFGITHLILSIVPSNILDALSKGEMLALIFFALLFGYGLSKTSGEGSQTIKNAFQGLFDVMIKITQLIMKCLPSNMQGAISA